MRAAAIGIGSNSLRMLVADLKDHQLYRLKRYREGLRVFAALDDQGNIRPEMIRQACESVKAFQLEALKQGAEVIHLFATSAVRDAANQQTFSDALGKATGLELEICSGDTEANLSFWGAASSQKKCGLIDIGGGSTEIVVGQEHKIDFATSLQMGAVRLFRQIPIQCAADSEKVAALARDILHPYQKTIQQCHADEWIGVGGTFTTSTAVVQRIPWQQRENIHQFVMTQQQVKETMDFLAEMPLDQRLQLDCLQPQRADIVVHGIAILLACMRELNVASIMVSEHGNLEGYLKAKYILKNI